MWFRDDRMMAHERGLRDSKEWAQVVKIELGAC